MNTTEKHIQPGQNKTERRISWGIHKLDNSTSRGEGTC